ncbi:hypothetical protein J4526_02520 [Desulfurococcaceae archaeon MEX13E-LK6-19]|nr:hypothetical protein J4526_02520 [Desulfurococcaceae archaeon MEX13E-LK6-19]
MFNIAIQIHSITAERLSEGIPPNIQFQINLSIPSSTPFNRGKTLVTPFSFTISSRPPVVQISIKGYAIVSSSDTKALEKMLTELKNKRVPQFLLQTVFANMIAESIILSRSLGVPPPVPPLPPPQMYGKKNTNTSYTPVQ